MPEPATYKKKLEVFKTGEKIKLIFTNINIDDLEIDHNSEEESYSRKLR